MRARGVLATTALVAFATHVLAALASLFLLRPGTPTGADAAARAAYVATHLAEWRVGWLSWTLASLSLVALLFALHRRAAWLAVGALAFDLPAQLALAIPAWSYERIAYLSTGVVANGMYTAALLVALLRAPLPRRIALAGAPAVGAGALVSVAAALAHPTLLLVATGALTVFMIAWCALVGAWALRRDRSR